MRGEIHGGFRSRKSKNQMQEERVIGHYIMLPGFLMRFLMKGKAATLLTDSITIARGQVRLCRLLKYLKRLWLKNFTHSSSRLCDRSVPRGVRQVARTCKLYLRHYGHPPRRTYACTNLERDLDLDS